MKTFEKMILIVILLFFMTDIVAAEEGSRLKVGIQIKPPFIMKNNDQYIGVSIDLWRRIADSLDTKYTLIEYTLPDLLNAIKSGEVDIAISPLMVTSTRIKEFGFSQPYYITNLAYATKSNRDGDFVTLISNIFSVGFLKSLFPLLFIISIFGTIIWALERKKNSKQFGKGIHGVGSGIWWSAVTMSTVGYGDKSPITPIGRLISIIWMFTAVIMISGLTASVSSSLTINRLKTEISTFDDLRKTEVGCIPGSGSSELLNRYKIQFTDYETVDEGLTAVDKDNITAFVYDDAVLSYYVHNSKLDEKIQIVPTSYAKEYFSFASSNYELLGRVDKFLLNVIESDEWERDLEKYHIEYRN
jgi:polar amino acid transport system substrate-binding protein